MELKEKSKMKIWCSHVCGELNVNQTSSYHDCFNENVAFRARFQFGKVKTWCYLFTNSEIKCKISL